MTEIKYKVVWTRELAVGVEIISSMGVRRVVSPFSGKSEAESWIAEEKWKTAMSRSTSRPRSGTADPGGDREVEALQTGEGGVRPTKKRTRRPPSLRECLNAIKIVAIHGEAVKFEIAQREIDAHISSLDHSTAAKLTALDALHDGASRIVKDRSNSPILDFIDRRRRETEEG